MIDPINKKKLLDLVCELGAEGVEELRKDLFESDDITKLETVAALIDTMTPAFKGCLAERLQAMAPGATGIYPEGKAAADDKGELNIQIESNEENVRMSFGAKVAWIAFPKSQALQLACLLLEHAGAKIERTLIPPN